MQAINFGGTFDQLFPLNFFYKIFTEDASQPLLYHGAKKSKMTKNSNQGGSCLKFRSGEALPWQLPMQPRVSYFFKNFVNKYLRTCTTLEKKKRPL